MIRKVKNQKYVSATVTELRSQRYLLEVLDNIFTECMVDGYTPVTFEVQRMFLPLHFDEVCTIKTTNIKQGRARARKCYKEDDYPYEPDACGGSYFDPAQSVRVGLRSKAIADMFKILGLENN